MNFEGKWLCSWSSSFSSCSSPSQNDHISQLGSLDDLHLSNQFAEILDYSVREMILGTGFLRDKMERKPNETHTDSENYCSVLRSTRKDIRMLRLADPWQDRKTSSSSVFELGCNQRQKLCPLCVGWFELCLNFKGSQLPTKTNKTGTCDAAIPRNSTTQSCGKALVTWRPPSCRLLSTARANHRRNSLQTRGVMFGNQLVFIWLRRAILLVHIMYPGRGGQIWTERIRELSSYRMAKLRSESRGIVSNPSKTPV